MKNIRLKLKSCFSKVHAQQGGWIVVALVVLAAAFSSFFLFERNVMPIFDRGDGAPEGEGETEVLDWAYLGCWYSEPTSARSQFGDGGNVFVCQDSQTLSTLDIYAGRKNSGNHVYRVAVFTGDGVAEEPDELLGYSNTWSHNTMEVWTIGSGVLPQWTITFDTEVDPIVFIEDAEYVFEINVYSGNSGDIYRSIRTTSHPCDTDVILGNWEGDVYREGYLFEFWLTGFSILEPTVTTIASEIRGDGSVWLSGWCDVFGEQEVGFFVSETEAVVTNGTGIKYRAGETDSDNTREYFSTRVVSILSDVTYYYRAYAILDGVYYYGAVKNFQRIAADMLPELDAQVIENSPDVVEFEVSIIGIPETTSWNLTLYYGRDISECYSHNYSIEIEENVTVDGIWYIEEPPDTFDYGAKYWYYACGEEALGSTICSSIRAFTVYDPTQPAFVNWITRYTGLDITWLWWVLVIIGLFAVWFIAAQRKWWWLGVIGTGVGMVLLITFGYVSPWVVVVLVIIVGWIIFKLVFQKSGGTSS